jgi:hypothetical protein
VAAVPVERAEDEFGLEFVDASGSRRRETLAACWGVPFETAAPVRAFGWAKGSRNFAGWWWLATTSDHVGFESWLERDHLMVLDFDPKVVGVAAQPFWLRWHDGVRERRHAPDFFVRLADGTGMVVDVRADERIEPSDREAFEATERACDQAGWRFRRLGGLDAVVGSNVRWLSRYRHPRCEGRPEMTERLLDVFAQPTPLFDGAEAVGDRIAVLPALFHLMWLGRLAADLAAGPLGPSSVVAAAGERG